MTKKSALVIGLILLVSWVLLLVSNHPTLTISGPLIRETQPVFVNGSTEMWQLQWHAPPRPRCDILDGGWSSAPCQGFAYGEAGQLDLVRYRNGYEYERLPLTPFFTGFPEHEAVVKRWPKQKNDPDPEDHPLDSLETQALMSRVRARPEVKIISLADTDHDGNATEFFLPTGPATAATGLPYGIVVGVSTTNPHLHAFGTALHPDTPLVLNGIEWFELLHRGDMNVPVRVLDRKCSDHGATTDIELELEATPKGISVISREYAECGKEPHQLIKQEYR